MAKIKLMEKAAPKCESFSPKTVKIGDQTWMAENLAVDDGGKGIYLNEETGEYYYTWEAAARIAKNIPGWHLPAAGEWDAAAEACGALKAPGGYNVYAHVESLRAKLNIELAGRLDFRRDGERAIYYENVYANVWTSTEETSTTAYSRDFSGDGDMYRNTFSKHRVACSVRLVKG